MKGYDPEKGSQQDKDEHPEKYRLQGIYAGLVDDLAESLIEREPPQGDSASHKLMVSLKKNILSLQ